METAGATTCQKERPDMAKIKKKRKPKNIIFKIAVLVFAIAVVGRLVTLQVDIAQKKRELVALQDKVEQQTNENKELQQLLDSGMDRAYIEKIAREKLGYVSPRERVFVDITQE